MYVDLDEFGLIRFAGEDAQSFLHGQLSCDVSGLPAGCATYGSYNTPKGRMLATFLLWRDDDSYLMQLPRVLREPIQKRLTLYILRSKVRATDATGDYALIGVAGAAAEAALKSSFADLPAASLVLLKQKDATVLRLPGDRFEIIATPERAQRIAATLGNVPRTSQTVWHKLDIAAGIPQITPATQDQLVPQMANLDLIGGVSFNKGCYPGQEIVARMHYLGRLKQRMYRAHVHGNAAPMPGDKLYSAAFGDQACGLIVSAAPAHPGHDVLASIQTGSVDSGDIHLQSPDGPRLELLDLPYKV